VIYDKGKYYVYKPCNPDKKTQANLIENYPWLVAKFMPSEYIKLDEDDVVRFGRIPFRCTKICLGGRPTTEPEIEGPGKLLLPDEMEKI
jgi:hypothetical protein